MKYDVAELVARAQATAVIAEATTWETFPSLWPELLDEVWQEIRKSTVVVPGRNVMLYKDDVPNVEIGAEVAEPFANLGRVVCSSLPAGRVLTTTHLGRPKDLASDLALAHREVIDACHTRGLRRLGPRWEIYGHWTDTSIDQEVEICYLVE